LSNDGFTHAGGIDLSNTGIKRPRDLGIVLEGAQKLNRRSRRAALPNIARAPPSMRDGQHDDVVGIENGEDQREGPPQNPRAARPRPLRVAGDDR